MERGSGRLDGWLAGWLTGGGGCDDKGRLMKLEEQVLTPSLANSVPIPAQPSRPPPFLMSSPGEAVREKRPSLGLGMKLKTRPVQAKVKEGKLA